MSATQLNSNANNLPLILAGPILRHTSSRQVNFWLASSEKVQITAEFSLGEKLHSSHLLTDENHQQVQVGQRAYIHLVTVNFAEHESLPINSQIDYNLLFTRANPENGDKKSLWLTELIPDICYQLFDKPNFAIRPKIGEMLHGSCRKPHFDSEDALCQIDNLFAEPNTRAEDRPSLLMMSGDQVYLDDVAGPTLSAILQVISLLGLFQESWRLDHTLDSTTIIATSEQLFESEQGFYQRHLLLPHDSGNQGWQSKLFGQKKQPIFTSVNAKNHLVTLSEVLALYLLTWSPTLWAHVDIKQANVPAEFQALYQQELTVIESWVSGLGKVRRALAHIPVYMIFDDHDITDDWNLTRGWEEAAYQNPFSKRIIGNGLIGYYLCQGWGNAPQNFQQVDWHSQRFFTGGTVAHHDELVDQVLDWQHWHYHLNTEPKTVVLDTRTQRWRSESNANKPSGLMDWESLSELQQELIDQPSVIMVSAAPVYGVKLIEAVQKIFTVLGKPLAVDAENWMAHSGTANVMLNIFRHHKTPPDFIILSGDVHYSFVYDVTHRFIRSESRIVQITCSGIKNAFPPKLLMILERLNRILYASNSPLNWFTKRRQMKIKVRKPSEKKCHSLYNGSGIGLLQVADGGDRVNAQIITATGERVSFAADPSHEE